MIPDPKLWAEHVREANIMWGTVAHHQLGEISRPDGDFFHVTDEKDEHYVGQWLTGYGFINVRFPKDGVREISWIERRWLAEHPVVI